MLDENLGLAFEMLVTAYPETGIEAIKGQLLDALEGGTVAITARGTGSGKSTVTGLCIRQWTQLVMKFGGVELKKSDDPLTNLEEDWRYVPQDITIF